MMQVAKDGRPDLSERVSGREIHGPVEARLATPNDGVPALLQHMKENAGFEFFNWTMSVT
jgi:hypothetical protein